MEWHSGCKFGITSPSRSAGLFMHLLEFNYGVLRGTAQSRPGAGCGTEITALAPGGPNSHGRSLIHTAHPALAMASRKRERLLGAAPFWFSRYVELLAPHERVDAPVLLAPLLGVVGGTGGRSCGICLVGGEHPGRFGGRALYGFIGCFVVLPAPLPAGELGGQPRAAPGLAPARRGGRSARVEPAAVPSPGRWRTQQPG